MDKLRLLFLVVISAAVRMSVETSAEQVSEAQARSVAL